MQYIHQLHQFYSSYILLFYRWCPQACSNRRGLESRASVTRTESMGGLIMRVSTAAWEGSDNLILRSVNDDAAMNGVMQSYL